MSDEGASFLSRWSRRKRAAANDPVPASDQPAAPAPPAPAVEAAPAGSISAEAPAFDPASLPPVESLTAESDFTAFLRDEVPAALRQAALRRAWSLDPVIRTFTGPADYAWDFNAPDGGMAGFSPKLTGDLQRLLAQAIGLNPAPAEEAADQDRLPDAGAVLRVAEPAAVAAVPSPTLLLPAPDALPSVPAVSLVTARVAPEAPTVLPERPAKPPAIAPGTPIAPSPAAGMETTRSRRRHGGALPT